MKKLMISGVTFMLVLAGCQMKNDPVNGKTKTVSEIILTCKNSEDASTNWEISFKENALTYYTKGKSTHLQLSENEVQELNNLLEKNNAHKIKTKTVAQNHNTNWVSVTIVQPEFTVRCNESFNYKLTKKSRKKLEAIRKHIFSLIAQPGQTENQLVLVE